MPTPEEQAAFCTPADGYRSIWHGQTPQDDEYAYKYSGALGTYCAKHRPQAVYCPEARKTFWVYGGTSADDHAAEMSIQPGQHMAKRKFFGPGQLLPTITCIDHDTRRISAPIVLFDKWCGDPHDNPVLTVDKQGHIFVFVPSHGPWTTASFILRSKRPYDHTAFEVVEETLFAYPQPWPIDEAGLVLLHTQYDEARHWLCVASSENGVAWSESRRLAHIERGQYMVSIGDGRELYGAFNMHPREGGLERRTNLYVMRSGDGGATWRNMAGKQLTLPLDSIGNDALLEDWRARGQLVYLKDITLDEHGNPVVLYITSGDNLSGPKAGPRVWRVAAWTGEGWRHAEVGESDSNYDTGSIVIRDDAWRVIGPIESGPQPHNPGGEMAVLLSEDSGDHWEVERALTQGSPFNHTYARAPTGSDPFVLAVWASGDCRKPGPGSLHLADTDGNVYNLPRQLTEDAPWYDLGSFRP